MIKTNTFQVGLLAALMLPMLGACRKDSAAPPAESPAPQAAESPAAAATETILWEPLPELPHAVRECTCEFSANADAFARKQYLYGDNGSSAFVKLDGKQRRLVSVKFEERGHDHLIKTFHDGFYWMTVDLQQEKQTEEGQELFKETGTITITAKDGRSVAKEVVGECGC